MVNRRVSQRLLKKKATAFPHFWLVREEHSISEKFETTITFWLEQQDYSLSISMRDCS